MRRLRVRSSTAEEEIAGLSVGEAALDQRVGGAGLKPHGLIEIVDGVAIAAEHHQRFAASHPGVRIIQTQFDGLRVVRQRLFGVSGLDQFGGQPQVVARRRLRDQPPATSEKTRQTAHTACIGRKIAEY